MIAALALLALTLEEPVLTPLGHHPYRISSASMQPGLSEGDVVFADRSAGVCGSTDPSPGDVVVVRTSGAPWLKRIVAGPGQTVRVTEGALYIDGVAVQRERVDAGVAPGGMPKGAVPGATLWRETLPSGRSWLILDLQPGGPLDDRAEVRVPEGRWFALGDNRDNSIDDRIHGPTAAGDLCGIVVSVARSDEPSRVGLRP